MTIINLLTGRVGPNLSKEFLTNGRFRYYCQLASSYSFKSMVVPITAWNHALAYKASMQNDLAYSAYGPTL